MATKSTLTLLDGCVF